MQGVKERPEQSRVSEGESNGVGGMKEEVDKIACKKRKQKITESGEGGKGEGVESCDVMTVWVRVGDAVGLV
ncbi:hypothetical protein E2C01_040270 [Portunus trituberculatus]|uniref:Uncharacterized protein n=1 Tax=Portunus trituberculatus TaxID=210409 RepID=A0A5B7FG20_PORTR|nr:hypothetical protein [Portunus trituberculatus]